MHYLNRKVCWREELKHLSWKNAWRLLSSRSSTLYPENAEATTAAAFNNLLQPMNSKMMSMFLHSESLRSVLLNDVGNVQSARQCRWTPCCCVCMYDQWLLRNALHRLRALDSAKNTRREGNSQPYSKVLTSSNQWIMLDHFVFLPLCDFHPLLLYLVVWFVVVAVSCLTSTYKLSKTTCQFSKHSKHLTSPKCQYV